MIVFDVEANGLLDDATKIHCLSYTSDGKNYRTCLTTMICEILFLVKKHFVGHNIVRYDAPLLRKNLRY